MGSSARRAASERGLFMTRETSLRRRGVNAHRADCRALCAAASRLLAHHDQPHSDMGPVRARLRSAVRLHWPSVVRTVGILRLRRHVRRLSDDRSQFSVRHDVDRDRRDGCRRHRLSRRFDRPPPDGDLFRHDHGGDRGGVLLRRVQSAVRLHRRRERAAGRADAEFRSRLYQACDSTATRRCMYFWRSGISSVW